jgi:anti-sigma B factor antagonist
VLLDAVDDAAMVYVDLAALRFLDSSGLHALVTAYQTAQQRGGQLYLVNATGAVATLLDVTGVGELLRPPADGAGPVRS